MSDKQALYERLIKQSLQKINAAEAEIETLRHAPIAVVGVGCRLPSAENPTQFWQLLRDGNDPVREVPADRWDANAFYDPMPRTAGKSYVRHAHFLDQVDQFDAPFFGISPREAMMLDPQQRLLLEVTWEALESAGIPPTTLRGTQTGVFMGMMSYQEYAQMGSAPHLLDPYTAGGTAMAVATGRISYILGTHGPSMVVSTACSASLVAVHLAVQSLRRGECDVALVGGVNLLLSPNSTIAQAQAQMLAHDGRCKTFDASADGMGRGEGCGVIALKRLTDAERDCVWGVIRGTAVNHDGPSSGLTVPSEMAQAQLIRAALSNAKATPQEVAYIEAHGTGTKLGDPIEMGALGAVFGKEPLIVGSVKSNLGHLEAAAGITGLIKVLLAMRHEKIPPHPHFETPNPMIDWELMNATIPTELVAWPDDKKLAGVSSFGVGGTNAHVVLEKTRIEENVDGGEDARHLLVLSAKSEAALRGQVTRYGEYIIEEDVLKHSPQLGNVCYTAAVGRSHYPYRLAVVGDCTETLVANLQTAEIAHHDEPPRIAFLFTGQGGQYPNMGRELYESQHVFRQTIDECAAIVAAQGILDRPLLDVLYPADPNDRAVDDTRYTHPALFAVEYALAQLWLSWGVEPTALLGHSMGEYTAACVAGVFSLADGLRLVTERGRLTTQTAAGCMAAVKADAERVADCLHGRDGVSIAAVNGPDATVISGSPTAIEQAKTLLNAHGIKVKVLNISFGSHSPLMEPVMGAFERVVRGVGLHRPKIRLISNAAGQLVSDEMTDPAYWTRHLRQPVQFAAGMATLGEMGIGAFIEVSPLPMLLSMGQHCLPASEAVWLPTLRPNDEQTLWQSVGQLYTAGVEIDWNAFYAGKSRHKVSDLPTYAWQRQRHWLPETKPTVESSPVLQMLANGDQTQLIQQLMGGFALEQQAILSDVVAALIAAHRNFDAQSIDFAEWYYQIDWQLQTVTTADPLTISKWCIIADNAAIAQPLADHLMAQGAACVVMDRWDATVDADEIVYCAGESDDPLSHCERVLTLIQQLIDTDVSPHLWMVTTGAQPVAGETLSPEQATLWGLGKVAALEHPELRVRLVDIGCEVDIDGLAQSLLRDSAETQIAFRDGRRYVARLVQANPPTGVGVRFSAEKTILITGGLGGLGLAVARWMVEQGARRLVLIGRSSPSTQAQQLIDQLTAKGAQINVMQADVSQRADVERVFNAIDPVYPLCGIIHAAGTLDDGVLRKQTIDRFRTVFGAKVDGARWLHEFSAELPLDFFILFSSAASLLGSASQANHAAANSFMDALAHYRVERGLVGLSINWGAWESVGAAAHKMERITQRGVGSISPQQGIKTLAQWFNQHGQVGIVPIMWDEFREQVADAPLFERFVEPTTVERRTDGQPRFADAIRDAPVEQHRAILREHLHSDVRRVLGFPPTQPIAPKTGFFDLGMDSLMAVELRNRLQKTFGVALSSTLAFDYPNPAALEAYIAEQIGVAADTPQLLLADEPAVNGHHTDEFVAEVEQLQTMAALEAAIEAELQHI